MAKLLVGVDSFVEDWESGKIIAGYQNMKNRGNVVKVYDVEAKKEYETFGDAIRDFREQTKLSITELAAISDVSARTIYRLEARERKPNYRSRTRMLNSFNIHPSEKREEIERLPAK